MGHEYSLTYALMVFGTLGLAGQTLSDTTPDEGKASAGHGSAPASYVRPVVVAPAKAAQPWLKPTSEAKVDWGGLLRDSLFFATTQHAFRLASEPGTREGMKGPFFSGWGQAAGSLHGWTDGDPYFVNYVGHPMQGSVSGHIWVNNDRRYQGAEFGPNRDYWASRVRATAFSAAYSVMFEIGPYSEASIGNVQAAWPQRGFVDHVITPSVGLLWMIAEDAIDQHIIKRIEARVSNRPVRVLARGLLNPSRSWANMMALRVPWSRNTRPGVYTGQLDSYFAEQRGSQIRMAETAPKEIQGEFGVASVELNAYARAVHFVGTGTAPCLGGGAEVAFRVVDQMQWIVDVSGCNLLDLDKNWSGDTLMYTTGPKWTPRPSSRWSPHAYFLVGGMNITKERIEPELRESLNLAAELAGRRGTVRGPSYTTKAQSNAFAVAAGGGVDMRLHPAFALRLANLEYRHSWNPALNGQNYNYGLAFTTGMVLRMGTW